MPNTREKLIELLCQYSLKKEWVLSVGDLADFLIANGVEIPVRCKDCKHWTMGYCNNFACYDYEPTTNEDDFCSYGERREGNVE